MTLAEIEELRARGWHFNFTGDQDGWECRVVGRLAYGQGSGKTIEQAADMAMSTVRLMEDDPRVLIRDYGTKLERLAKDIFGEGVYQGMEPVDSPDGEPVKIAMSIVPKIDVKSFMEQDRQFSTRLIAEFPREVSRAIVLEVDWS